jgi:exonuclease SbcD
MKILHTSDWHIGKKIMGRERYDEFIAVLSEIADICERERVELVLVAGDVYDTYTPSAEAERIFFNGVKQIAKHSAVLIISGNHDDYVRLTAASNFASELNVYIVGNSQETFVPNTNFSVFPEVCENGYMVFKNAANERVYINILPYPNEARQREGKSDESYLEKIARWINYGERGKAEENSPKIPSIFLSHIFVTGGAVSDSEREIDLGGARLVNPDLLPRCDYCALGHLHKSQDISSNIHYSGAIMQFSFDEAGTKKYVNVFDLDESGVNNFKKIELSSARQLARLQCNSVDDGLKLLEANSEKYVELTINLSSPLTPSESLSLRSFENLISLRANIQTTENVAHVSNKNKPSSQLFKEFYKSRYTGEPTEELLNLFLSLTEEE